MANGDPVTRLRAPPAPIANTATVPSFSLATYRNFPSALAAIGPADPPVESGAPAATSCPVEETMENASTNPLPALNKSWPLALAAAKLPSGGAFEVEAVLVRAPVF